VFTNIKFVERGSERRRQFFPTAPACFQTGLKRIVKRPKYVCHPNAHVQLNIDLQGVSLWLGSRRAIKTRQLSSDITQRSCPGHFRQLVGMINANYCKPAGHGTSMQRASIETSVRILERHRFPPGVRGRYQLATASVRLQVCEIVLRPRG
jgi:hypothetical protein